MFTIQLVMIVRLFSFLPHPILGCFGAQNEKETAFTLEKARLTDRESAPDAVRYDAEWNARQRPNAVRPVIARRIGRYAGTDSQISGVEHNAEAADHDE